MINHDSSIPLYIQLSGILEEAIYNKDYKDGEKLPSENQLCKQYNVSRITVRQALSKLEQKNLVYSVHGKGTFVRLAEISQGLVKITSFQKTLEQKGLTGYTEIEDYSLKKIPETIKIFFEVPNVARLCLVGYANDMPIVYYNSYLISTLASEMYPIAQKWEQEKKAFSTWDIYPEISIRNLHMEQKLSAVIADANIAKILKVSKGDPVMKMETHAYSNGNLVEYKIAYYRADKYSFTIKRELDNNI
ncbi:MAG: GntR family transcriptional regulator [Oscillospiraceae bacterium]|nr:GntR family transcriptional regulator [Oscillospiraceae bacterium]MBR2504185.1 GntR family transcriptional regulator [Oscillospiraceae bacterium]